MPGGQESADLPQRFQTAHQIGGHFGQIGHFLFDGRQDFDPFDRVDAQIRFDVHLQAEHLGRITGQLADNAQQGLLDFTYDGRVTLWGDRLMVNRSREPFRIGRCGCPNFHFGAGRI